MCQIYTYCIGLFVHTQLRAAILVNFDQFAHQCPERQETWTAESHVMIEKLDMQNFMFWIKLYSGSNGIECIANIWIVLTFKSFQEVIVRI